MALAGSALSRPAAFATGDPTCRQDARELVRVLSRNYAGWDDAVARLGADSIASAERALTSRAGSTSGTACDRTLREFLVVFQDDHLQLASDYGDEGVDEERPEPLFDHVDPRFEVLSDSTALLRIPSFDISFKGVIDSLTAAHEEAIRERPNLIVDVRMNGGGSDASYESMMPILYSGPYEVQGAEFLATEENRAIYEEILETLIPESAVETRRQIRELIESMRGKEREFVLAVPDQVVEYDEVWPRPRRVALLTDRWCASTCDQFVLEASESDKVTTFGEPTSGVIDYSNLLPAELPSGERVVWYPTSRSTRLPENPIPPEGIPVDVELGDKVLRDADRAIERVRDELESRS